MTGRLPGQDLVEKGLADLRAGEWTSEALLVAIGAPRLSRLGMALPADLPDRPEHRLYGLLAATDRAGAHSRYNALIRRLVSYEDAADARARR